MEDAITSKTIIDLGEGWHLSFDACRDDGSLQAFIINNKEGRSASLNFALETGDDSTKDEPIPQDVLDEAREYEEYA